MDEIASNAEILLARINRTFPVTVYSRIICCESEKQHTLFHYNFGKHEPI